MRIPSNSGVVIPEDVAGLMIQYQARPTFFP
jgi:hypothetical protein